MPCLAQGGPLGQIPAWASEQIRDWSVQHYDARGNGQWTGKKWNQVSSWEQQAEARARLSNSQDRRAALWALTAWPVEQWDAAALARGGPEAAQFLYQRGYRQSGPDPYAYLGAADLVRRPWTHGLGLHLDKGGWRFQWIPSPALFTQTGNATWPKGLEGAAQPSAILHLKQLRPGLERLYALSGGAPGAPAGIVPALAQGSRAGFTLRHLEPWLRQVSPALEPLAQREAWVLHYGAAQRDRGDVPQGTLVFIPGDLPTRTKLMLGLLQLNPTSSGARVRVVTWTGPGASTDVQQLRGSGGVFHLIQRVEGTWISDREAPLRALLFPGPQPTLGERREWARVALSALTPDTEVSFWIAPRIGADSAFECTALRGRLTGAQQGTWPNPFIAKAAPRTGAVALALGAGPTERLIQSLFRVDVDTKIPIPEMPAFAQGGAQLSPVQLRQYQEAVASAKERQKQLDLLRQDATTLLSSLDLRGAALFWNGWAPTPPLNAVEKAALTELSKLRREDPWRASNLQREGRVAAFGGFGEPGMSPSLALALPLQPAKRTLVENILKKLLPRVFKGQNQKQPFGTTELHRVRTAQAFTPAWALVGDTLVLGSDDSAVKAVAAGLLGQAPTLADSESRAWARMEADGPRVAAELENLLLAFLRTRASGAWWFGETAPAEDEAAAELAYSLGPFLGAVKAMGTVRIEWNWTPGGLEGRPR